MNKRHISSGAGRITAASILIVAVLTGCGGDRGRIVPDDVELNSRFGAAVAATEDFRFVGSPGHGGPGTIFVFENARGVHPAASISPFQGGPGDLFGAALDARGDAILIGAPISEIDGVLAGRAFVYRYSVDRKLWLQEDDLTSDDPSDLDYFGSSVALGSDVAVVGVPGDDDAGSNTGSAFFFRHDAADWTRVAKLTPEDGVAGDRFGESVAVEGNRVLVGSPFAMSESGRPGAAYLYEVVADSGLRLIRRLVPKTSESDQQFGAAVAISGGIAFVGAPGGGNPAAPGGTVSIFDLSQAGDRPGATLSAGDGVAEAGFGAAIDIEEGFLMIGSQRAVGDHAGPGSAYMYSGTGTSWELLSLLPGSEASRADGFGESVAVSSGVAVVGASGDSGAGPHAGAVYFYSGNSSGWR